MSQDWASWAPEVRTPIDCGGSVHHLAWADGRLHAEDHDDELGERTLAALGGEQHACLDVIDCWMRHADDLRLLLLGSRGPADPLRVPEHLRSGIGPGMGPGMGPIGFGTGAGIVKVGRRRPASIISSTGMGTAMPNPMRPPVPEDPDDIAGLLLLLGLGGGVPHRLCATVAAHWTGVLDDDADRAVAHLAELRAALHGRVRSAVGSWLDDPTAEVIVEMTDRSEAPSVDRVAEALQVAVPFRWLVDVWAPGLAVVAGNLVLAVDRVGDRLEMDAVAIDLVPRHLSLEGFARGR